MVTDAVGEVSHILLNYETQTKNMRAVKHCNIKVTMGTMVALDPR